MTKKKVVEKVTEPRQRKDGKCVICGKLLPLLALRMGDPFCSAVCCRKHYNLDERS